MHERETIAHLMRRAGVGVTQSELDALARRPYEEVVEDLLHPERFLDLDDEVLLRYFPVLVNADTPGIWSGRWIWRMAYTARPLQEKMALFWHQIFATAWYKSEHTPSIVDQVEMFRKNGMDNLRSILLNLSRDPAMMYWLDNCENRQSALNENYGRELLELFSMGIGNYTETDVKMAARAFTGWSFEQPIPLYPYGLYPSRFVYRVDEHDDREKTFLGEHGPFDGEDVISIIVRQEATARFIARHLYSFFVADEAPVSAWSVAPPRDRDAIEALVECFLSSDGDIRSVLRMLFNAEFFKVARFQRVKCPAEFIAGTIKLAGTLSSPEPRLTVLGPASAAMGQALYDPPSVEGWHTGKEWIDGGTLMERVNFAVGQFRDPNAPGVRALAELLCAEGNTSPGDVVARVLEFAGDISAGPETQAVLLDLAGEDGDLTFDTEEAWARSQMRVARLLSLVVSVPEFQFA